MEEHKLRSRLLAFLVFALAGVAVAQAAEPAKLKIAVLKFGTVSWVLDAIHANGLDKAEGIELDITLRQPLWVSKADP